MIDEITITYRKLGKEKARGQYIAALNLIELDCRLEGQEHLEILIHESLHALQPHHEEDTVARDAANLAAILWADGYRRLPEEEETPRPRRKPRQNFPSGKKRPGKKTTPHKLSKTINKCGPTYKNAAEL